MIGLSSESSSLELEVHKELELAASECGGGLPTTSPRSDRRAPTLSNSMSIIFPSQIVTWIEIPGSGQNSQSELSDWALRPIDRKGSEYRAVDAA